MMEFVTAREFQVDKLSWDRMTKMHELERKDGRPFSPYEVRLRAKDGMPAHGSIPETRVFELERRLMAMYKRIQRQVVDEAGSDGDYCQLDFLHALDREVKRSSNFDFSPGGSGGENRQLMDRIKKATRKADEEIPF